MAKKFKIRLDDYLLEKGLFDTKSQAQGAILAGKVKINGKPLTKAGFQINPEEEHEILIDSMPYVSRGGFKLEKALKEFDINLSEKVCIDAGASTGGFTDCMLQSGAVKVYAVDVGYGQIAWKLRNDVRVEVIERINIRNASVEEIYADNYNKLAEFCSIDVSFISLTKILENIKRLMNSDKKEIVALIKPQFEAGKEQVPKNGVIKDKNIHIDIIKNIVDFAANMELYPISLTFSPIRGPAGNIEYLIYLKNNSEYNKTEFEKLIIETVEKSHEYFNKNKITE